MSYINEATDNFEKSVFHLIKYGCIDVACIYCQNTYKIQNKDLLYITKNRVSIKPFQFNFQFNAKMIYCSQTYCIYTTIPTNKDTNT